MRFTRNSTSGFTLIELIVAMSLLGFVLTAASHVLMQTMTSESRASAQMHALDLVRKSAAEHNALIPLAANSTIRGEGGSRLQLSATETIDADLGVNRRTQSVLSIDANGNAVQQVFEGSVRLIARPYLASLPSDDISATSGPSLERITLEPATVHGYVSGSGAYPHGTLVSILARPAPGNHFVRWSGATVSSATSAATFVLANNDKNIKAMFDVGAGSAGGILITPIDLGQYSWSAVYTVTTASTGLFTHAGHNYRIQQVTQGFYQSWGISFVAANLYIDTIAYGTQNWPQIGIFSTADTVTYPTLASRTSILTPTTGYTPYQAVVRPTVYQVSPPPTGPNPAVVLTLPSAATFGSASGWLVMQLN